MDQPDIWRTASVLIKLHGNDAGSIASERAEALLEKGDHTGFAVFLQIGRAIDDLRRTVPNIGEAVN